MEDDEDFGFRINKDYADKYNKWREKEELQKLKDKYGDVDLHPESSSDSESEDEAAEGLTPQIEKDWLKTLAALKAKDPKIYDKSVLFYHDTEESSSQGKRESSEKRKKKKKDKPVYLKDYERQVILEKGGKLSEDEDQEQMNLPHAYTSEQLELKASFQDAVASDSEDDEILTRRTKTKDEEEKEEEEYLCWLKGQTDDLQSDKDVGTQLESLKNYWDNPKLGEGEKFLRDYILNKRYIEKDDDDRIPTYDEIVNDHDDDFDDEEQELEKQETFERKFNFRFEEDDQEFIKSYPRTLKDSMRRPDEKRAKKREEVKERKQREKDKKKEEIKRLKNLKKKEIVDKIELLKKVTGNTQLGISEHDITEDFDPQKHDELMRKHFDSDYYNVEEGDTKPVFSDDEDLDLEEDWDKWTGYPEAEYYEGNGEGEGGDEGYSQDWDSHEKLHEDEGDLNFGLDGRSKKRKRSKFEQALKKKKPVFDPNSKTFEEYFDEYYKLDYEDIIGDQPCRFRYRQVPANDFGLSVQEVLACRDKELNAWVSLKKMSQYRSELEEQRDITVFQHKAKNIQKKLRILPSLRERTAEEATEAQPQQSVSKKRRKRKKPVETVTSAKALNMDGVDSKHTQVMDDGSNVDKKKKIINSDAGSGAVSQKNTNLASDTTITGSDNGKKKKQRKLTKDVDSVLNEGCSVDSDSITHGNCKTDKWKKRKPNGDVNGSAAKTGGMIVQKEREKLKEGKGLTTDGVNTEGSSKRKRKRKGKKTHLDVKETISADRLKAYGINPKKFKYMNIKKIEHSTG